MPREINVGYVMAMPKFTKTLKAVGRNNQSSRLHNEGVKLIIFISCMIDAVSDSSTTFLHMSSFRTKQQACDPTEVGPGDVCQ